jgi:hypothetical protein
MDTPQKVVALLDEAGYDGVQAQLDSFEFHWSARRLLTIQACCGPPSRRLVHLSPALRAECWRRVRRRLAPLDATQPACRLQVVSALAHKRAAAEPAR